MAPTARSPGCRSSTPSSACATTGWSTPLHATASLRCRRRRRFAWPRLRAAHRSGGVDTDDAALVEANGGVVVVVEGERTNLKITRAEDLDLARALLDGATL